MKYLIQETKKWDKEIKKDGAEYGTIFGQNFSLCDIHIKNDAELFPFYVRSSGGGWNLVFTGKTKLDALIEFFKLFGGSMKNETDVVFNKGNEAIGKIIGKGGETIKEIAKWYGKRINVKEITPEPYIVVRENDRVLVNFYNGKKDSYENYLIFSKDPDFHTNSYIDYQFRKLSGSINNIPMVEIFKDLIVEFGYELPK